jgi:hypothetical protein
VSKERLPVPDQTNQSALLEQIQQLEQALAVIEEEIRAFELVLRPHVSDLIVEEQELFVLYKKIKKAKKVR